MSKHVVIYPFFSQQDKATGQFLLESCGSTKMNLFLAQRITQRLGWSVTMVFPKENEVATYPDFGAYHLEPPLFRTFPMHIPSNNMYQRLHWEPEKWTALLDRADLCINHHEVLGWPLARMFPHLKIVQMNVVSPREPWPWMAPLFFETWKSVDLIVTLGRPMQDEIAETMEVVLRGESIEGCADIALWPLSYDEQKLTDVDRPIDKDIDLLFVLRGSSTNYSHHVEFLQAIPILRRQGYKGKIAFTDITRYMATNRMFDGLEGPIEILPEPKTQDAYVKMLWRSKAVIAMNDNQHGGMSFREAVYCGACPIVPPYRGYTDMVGTDWPYLIDEMKPESIAEAVIDAEANCYWVGTNEAQSKRLHKLVKLESFQAAWDLRIRPDLVRLMGERDKA